MTTTYRTARDDEATASRLAAIRARRAGVTYDRLNVIVADIKPGDFVDHIPSQAGVRGVTYECLISSVRTFVPGDHSRGRAAFGDVILFTADPRWATLIFPPTFSAMIRRPVAR